MPVIHGDDRRRLVPLALCSVLRTLIADEPEPPGSRRQELRTLLFRLERLYGLEHNANATQVAQDLAEEDGDAVSDAP